MDAYIWESNSRRSGVYRGLTEKEDSRLCVGEYEPSRATWHAITLVEEFHLDGKLRKPAPFSDFPDTTQRANIVSAWAVAALGEWLEVAGGLYPVQIQGFDEAFFFFHCTHVVDCLDRERSVFSPNGRIIKQPAFVEDRFPAVPIFMVPGHTFPVPMIFVLEPLKERVASAGLAGLELKREYFDPNPWRC